MKIRVIGNSCSGKTTLTRALSKYLSINVLHLDSIAFIPNSNFVLREIESLQFDVKKFVDENSDWIIDGNYLTKLDNCVLTPDFIIFIDLPTEQSVKNYNQRFEMFKGISRPELPNIIEADQQEMLDWIKDYPNRRERLLNFVLKEQGSNPFLKVLHIKDMDEIVNLCDNPSFTFAVSDEASAKG